jgi:CRISPR-associated protein Csm1
MSLQVFLQAQLLGAAEFLGGRSSERDSGTSDFIGCCAWLTLFCEVLPRALLAELKLSRMLLGSSAAEQFLLVLAEEDVSRANQLLNRAAQAVSKLSGNSLRLLWASTENLGPWPTARKRLDDALLANTAAPLVGCSEVDQPFAPFSPALNSGDDSYFSATAEKLPAAARVGWSSESPAHLTWDEGQYTWPLKEQSGLDDDGILFPRRFAMNDLGTPASLAELAQRAEGASRWGILLGDVDQFDSQLRRAATIEEHIHLSVLVKEFFAGELAVLCTMPDFWRKVTILYRGGDDFAVLGTWDALLMLARELQRLFEKFAEQHLQSLPGPEGKTISMALAIAPQPETPLVSVFQDAFSQLRDVKANEPGALNVFGRALEWKRLSDAEELKTSLVRLVKEFGYLPDYINDLASVYREAYSARAARRKAIRIDKPWRTYMRLSRVIPAARGRELGNLRNSVIASLIGKRTAVLKLRPSGRIGLEWARLAAGSKT